MSKRFKFDVYSPAGVYITTWNDVMNDFGFTSNVNGGLGEADINLARTADNYGESNDIAFDNDIIVTCFDGDNHDGVRVFNGCISAYTPALDDAGNEYLQVIVLGYVNELSQVELLDNGSGIQTSPTSGNTKLTYTAEDPSAILKDIIDKYNALTGVSGKIQYTTSPASIDSTGTTITYTFNATTILDAINNLMEFFPSGWYWYLDEFNVVQCHAFPTTPDYTLYVRKDIISIKPTKRIENIINGVYVTGGPSDSPLYKFYNNSSSISAYRRKIAFVSDNNVTTAAQASLLANATMQPNPETQSDVVVADNNDGSGIGFNIELLKPGKIINILNFLSSKSYSLWGSAIWGTDVWGYNISNVLATNVPIVKTTYTPDALTLQISSLLPQVANTIQTLDMQIQQASVVNNPSAPS